jgi:hypothetical protein
MTSIPNEKSRRWRRQLAFIYWGLSPLLAGILVRILLVPLLVAREYVQEPPPWSRWLVLAYLVCACVGAGAAMWALWRRVREIPPPVGS